MQFLATNFGWILAAIGGLGATAIGVAVLVFGVPALLIFNGVVGFFKELAKFFRTPLGQAIGIILLCAAAAFGGALYQAGHDAAEYKQKVAALNEAWRDSVEKASAAFIEARRARDDLVDKALDNFVSQKNSEIAQLQQKVDGYEGEDHPACVLTPADIDRVREREAAAPAAKPKPTVKRWLDRIRNRS